MNSLNINNQTVRSKSNNLADISYAFSLEMIRFVNSLPQDRVFLSIGDQLLRSSTSVGANIVEANASSSEKEFVKFSEIALKSSHKAEYWLSLIKDSYEELETETSKLISDVKDIRAMIESKLISVRGKRSD